MVTVDYGPRNWQIATARAIEREMQQRSELGNKFHAESAPTRSDRITGQWPAYSRLAMAIVARVKAALPMHLVVMRPNQTTRPAN